MLYDHLFKPGRKGNIKCTNENNLSCISSLSKVIIPYSLNTLIPTQQQHLLPLIMRKHNHLDRLELCKCLSTVYLFSYRTAIGFKTKTKQIQWKRTLIIFAELLSITQLHIVASRFKINVCKAFEISHVPAALVCSPCNRSSLWFGFVLYSNCVREVCWSPNS